MNSIWQEEIILVLWVIATLLCVQVKFNIACRICVIVAVGHTLSAITLLAEVWRNKRSKV